MNKPTTLHQIRFPQKKYPPLLLPTHAPLAFHLDLKNSPVLFGCRTGICGTCLVEILEVCNGELPPRTSAEEELLPFLAPTSPQARLACQLKIQADILLCPLTPE
jgi:ferredoxin